jgi:hypothetical protein
MAAMVPHSRRRRMQQLANMLRYKTISLNLKNTIIITLNSTIHGGQDDLILSAKLIRIAPETSSF